MNVAIQESYCLLTKIKVKIHVILRCLPKMYKDRIAIKIILTVCINNQGKSDSFHLLKVTKTIIIIIFATLV